MSISGPKRQEVFGQRIKQENEERSNVYSPSTIKTITWRELEWEGHVVPKKEIKSARKSLSSKPERKRNFWRTTSRSSKHGKNNKCI